MPRRPAYVLSAATLVLLVGGAAFFLHRSDPPGATPPQRVGDSVGATASLKIGTAPADARLATTEPGTVLTAPEARRDDALSGPSKLLPVVPLQAPVKASEATVALASLEEAAARLPLPT